MSFDLFGLVHKVTVFDTVSVDDGAGGLVVRKNSDIYTNRKCRVSMLSLDKDEAKSYGLDSGDYWQVVMQYSPLVDRSQFIRITTASKAMAPNGDYRIVWQRPHQTEIGANHHHQIICEFEGQTIADVADETTLDDNLIAAYLFNGTLENSAGAEDNALPTLTVISGEESYVGESKEGDTSRYDQAIVAITDPSETSLNRDVNRASGELSFSMWIYPQSLAGSQGITSKATDATNREWDIVRSGSRTFVRFYEEDNSELVLLASNNGALALNEWNFIGFGIDDDEDVNGYQLVHYWSDDGLGSLQSTTRTGLNPVCNRPSALFQLGKSLASGVGFNGFIDAVQIADRMWTDAEWAEIYNSGAGKFYPF